MNAAAGDDDDWLINSSWIVNVAAGDDDRRFVSSGFWKNKPFLKQKQRR